MADSTFRHSSGFGPFEPIIYISREPAITIINNALNLNDRYMAGVLWAEWSQGSNIMPADKFGQQIFFHQSNRNTPLGHVDIPTNGKKEGE